MNVGVTGRKISYYSLFIVLIFMTTASGCAAKYTIKTEPISGKVVDAESNEPIEDVIVIGYWPGNTFYLHVSSAPTVEVLESVTDKSGNYLVPGWLKKNQEATFRYIEPQMIFYKTGYEVEQVQNKYSSKNVGNIPSYFHPWKAEWDGKTIKLKKFKGDDRAYREYVSDIHYSLWFEKIFNYCKYLNVPRLLIAMEEYYQTQPDYWVPGRTFTLSDARVSESYRTSEISQKNSIANQISSTEITSLENKPLPSILTITQLESVGSRCEVTPIEFLKRISSNEKDFIRSSNHDISTRN